MTERSDPQAEEAPLDATAEGSGKDAGSRGPPLPLEPLPPVEARILVEGSPDGCRVAIFEDGSLVEYIPSSDEGSRTLVGNVYLGRVSKLAPGVEAAFVNLGLEADGFLPEVEWPPERIKAGQAVVVQVQKDPIGEKGARISCRLALAGRHLVYLPGGDRVRISRRIPVGDERERLTRVGEAIMPEGGGMILRTAAVGQDEASLREDIDGLVLLDKQIRAKARALQAPNILFREPGPAARVVRDHLNHDVVEVVVDSPELASEVRSASFSVPAELLGRIRSEPAPFRAARVEREVLRALNPRVPLPSGGHVVIEQTEALVSIDVNSGGSKGGPDLEATALQTNLEAARVVARQLRLRDLGGILVVDFIDLEDPKNRKQVETEFELCLRRDRGNPRIHGWTDLGLMILSRRRRRMPLHRMLTRECPSCRGRGRVETEARLIERAAASCRAHRDRSPRAKLRLRLAPSLIPAARIALADGLSEVEIKGDRELALGSFRVEES